MKTIIVEDVDKFYRKVADVSMIRSGLRFVIVDGIVRGKQQSKLAAYFRYCAVNIKV